MTTRSVSCIDEQILAIWRALRVNPSLDARWSLQVIDRLLDERPRPDQLPSPVTPPGPVAPQAGLAGPQAVPTGPSGVPTGLSGVTPSGPQAASTSGPQTGPQAASPPTVTPPAADLPGLGSRVSRSAGHPGQRYPGPPGRRA